MPVPSIMMELSEAMVGTPKGRVASAQNFIMMGGPMVTHSSTFSRAQTSLSGSVTRALRP